MTAHLCATPGCDNPVPARRGTTGRPPIYCSAACRQALRLTRRRPHPDPPTQKPDHITNETNNQITVEIGQDPDNPTPMRSWTVTIHRGQHAVTVSHGLGRFAATALTADLQQLLHTPTDYQGGHPID
jgi:hypothetical protein